jgi:hypothetical protein
MREVCKGFASGRMANLRRATQALISQPLEPELVSMAGHFDELYRARQMADYDLSATYSRIEVDRLIALAERAFRDWHAIRGARNATVFLTALLLQRHWERGAA